MIYLGALFALLLSPTLLYSVQHSELNEKESAKQLIAILDTYFDQKETQAKLKKVPLNLSYALDQKAKGWNNRREKLKELMSKHLDSEIEKACLKKNISYSGYLSGPYGAEHFIAEAKSFDIKGASREETLLKNIYLEVFAEKLRAHNNLDPFAWSLNPDEWSELSAKLDEYPQKVGTFR